MKVLILSPHPDDVEIFMGGTIQKLIAQGHYLKVLFFSDCNIVGVREEIAGSMKVLGVKHWYLLNYPRRTMDNYRHEIRQLLFDEKDIDRVYCPHPDDKHQDHSLIAIEAVRALGNKTEIYYYLNAKNLSNIQPIIYSEITPDQLTVKWNALRCYKSQVKLRPKYFNQEFINAQSVLYGVMSGMKYAEAFSVNWIRHE